MWEAMYAGICPICHDAIHIGDLVSRDDDARIIHTGCIRVVRPAAVVCQTCFTEKPCICDDGL